MTSMNAPSAEDLRCLWRGYRAERSAELRNALLEHYLPLARQHAERYWRTLPNFVELDDLVSAATFGLIDAIEAFDLDRGVKFETYCVLRIRGAMADELRRMDFVPRLARRREKQLDAARRTIEVRTGRAPTEEELAAELGLTRDQLDQRRSQARPVAVDSIDQPWGAEDDGVRGVDLIASPHGGDPQQRTQALDLLRIATRGLSRQERLVVILYYYEGLSMRAIGRTLGVSESRVGQVHHRLVAQWRERFPRGNVRYDVAIAKECPRESVHV